MIIDQPRLFYCFTIRFASLIGEKVVATIWLQIQYLHRKCGSCSTLQRTGAAPCFSFPGAAPRDTESPYCRLCSGNLYTPTPELSVTTISTMLSTRGPAEATEGTAGLAGGAGVGAGGATGGWSWLPWSRKDSSSSSQARGLPSGLVHSHSDSLAPLRGQRTARPPHWRYSHSDAIYGFRPPPTGARLDLTNIDSLSNLLWGPPPPYSNPASTSGVSVSTSTVTPPQPPASTETESPQRSQSRLSRTTKSGILMSDGPDSVR